ncbi:hypothetical protein ACO0K9_12030 [Undibacterium sp. Ji50W]|uniref:hypothetical protein n=1 Tax=Undibacterium sp. Ji50W TaxID=3413041 RepID=UPI003BF45C90
MDLEEAKLIMRGCADVNVHLNNIALIVDTIDDVDLQKKLRVELSNAMGEIYLSLMRPIVKNFPEIDPDFEI